MKDKIVMITGAARGIGAATAQLCVKEGAFVILTDVLDQEGEALAKQLGASHAVYFHLDVSQANEWIHLADIIQNTYHHVDMLFNNAGIIGLEAHHGAQDPEHCSLELWHHVHSVNLDGVFLGCQTAIRLMKEKGGSIINMSSRSGIVGVPTTCAYASSKAAIRNLTKCVALYCAQMNYNIRCNSIHPGAILTPLWEPLFNQNVTRDQAIAEISAGIPLGHMGDVMDVAYAVLYLGSDESKYVTGSEMVLDGGILAGSSAAPVKR